jgi:phosphoserine phosphatase
MITFGGKTAFFDCDDTLLEWKTCDENEKDAIRIVMSDSRVFYKRALMANIEALKLHSLAGHVVVVWSAGGADWAEAIIHSLNLTDYVSLIIGKPDFYYDDKNIII